MKYKQLTVIIQEFCIFPSKYQLKALPLNPQSQHSSWHLGKFGLKLLELFNIKFTDFKRSFLTTNNIEWVWGNNIVITQSQWA